MSRVQRRAFWHAMVVGLAVTAVVLVVTHLGGLDWLERKSLDLRFRYANALPECDQLVCIDIDDESVTNIGRWPWPRDVQAGMLGVLHEAGARAILYDITLVEPEPIRPLVPHQADVVADPLAAGADVPAVAFPDLELRDTLARAGNVYLAFDYSERSTGHVRALRRAARDYLEFDPSRWQQPLHVLFAPLLSALAAVDPNTPHDPAEVAQALRYVLGEYALLQREFIPRTQVAGASLAVPTLSPPYYLHAAAARRCGFVVFDPDDDGVVRRMPLLVQYRGQVLPQLALAVAFDALGLAPEDVRASPGRLELHVPGQAAPLVVQLDGLGRAVIPWVPRRDWTREFGEHVPADALWQVYDRRLAAGVNRRLISARLATLLAAGELTEHAQYADDLRQTLRLEEQQREARYAGDAARAAECAQWLAEYARVLPAGEAKLRAALGETEGAAAGGPRHELRAAFAANAAYAAEIEAACGRLRARINGRIALVGYTATSLADMAPLPTHPRAPGVLAHANLLSGLLTGHTVSWAPAWANLLMAGLLGGLMTLASARYGPRSAGLAALLVVAYVFVAGWLAFYTWTYWVGLTPAVVAVLLSYVAVVVYRFLFVERESRQFARALEQYTSAALARQMAEQPELCRRAETRIVSAVFTDLAGFTTLSERIGAERTQRVLNVVLGRLSDVLLAHEALVNKFIGDGIFAFWNPVIYPQDDHARRACAAALDMQTMLAALRADAALTRDEPALADLILRVGVATGAAVVGPCGSEKKYDYTCVGDSVNIAARLESANKFYGTHILVSGATQAQAGDAFAYRWLGGVQVKGKTQAVPIYELLGRVADQPAAERQAAEQFAEGIAAFQQRHWAVARVAFEEALRRRADDLAAQRYVAACDAFAAQPPAEAWAGALELAEK